MIVFQVVSCISIQNLTNCDDMVPDSSAVVIVSMKTTELDDRPKNVEEG